MTEVKIIKGIECINTFQGEGPDMGQRMLLFRFKYCNRACSWCDTVVKMRVLQESSYLLDDLQKIIYEEKTGLLITGGEPTLNTDRYNQLNSTTLMLNELTYPNANVETNGYALTELIEGVNKEKLVKYIFSPKLFNYTDFLFAQKKVIEFKDIQNVYLKPVCDDNIYLIKFLDCLYKINFPGNRVFLMPKGKDQAELISNAPIVFDLAEKYKFNISSRTHLIYNFV